MRNAAATGTAAQPGMPFMRAYTHARQCEQQPSRAQARASPARLRAAGRIWHRGHHSIGSLHLCAPLMAAEPPAGPRQTRCASRKRDRRGAPQLRLHTIGPAAGDRWARHADRRISRSPRSDLFSHGRPHRALFRAAGFTLEEPDHDAGGFRRYPRHPAVHHD